MKLDKDESDSSNYALKRINNNLPRTMKELERFNSAYNQRPFTSFKGKKREFEKKQSFTRNNNYIIAKPNKALFASKYSNSNNLFFDKENLNIKRSRTRNKLINNDYGHRQEELEDKVIKLKKVLNQLNSQNTEQKVILYKQKRELKKQNQLLNKVKEKFFFENLYGNFDDDLNVKNNNASIGYKDNRNGYRVSSALKRQKSMEEIRSLPNQEKNNYNYEKPDYLYFKNNSYIKELYDKLVFQNERKDIEILGLKEKLEQNKLSNEANLSNIKMQYNKLKDELNKKTEELNKLKKDSKCTKYNEIMKEREIFESELINIKNKYNQAFEAQEMHKFCVKKMKFLMEEINNKNAKIELLENKLQSSLQNYQEFIENLEKELGKKNLKIQKLENVIKKLNVKINSSNNTFIKEKIVKKEKDGTLKVSNKDYFMITSTQNLKEENIKSGNNESEKSNKDKIINPNTNSELNNQNEDFDKKEKQDDIIMISEDNDDINLKLEKVDISETQNKDINSENINKESIQNNLIKNEEKNDIINSNNELLLIYLELNKRKINFVTFISEVFSKLMKDNSIIDNKKIYLDYLVKYFKISDDESKKIIKDLSNKEFKDDKTIEDIKTHHKEIFDEFENKQNKEKEKENELNQKLREINENKFKNITLKYDDIESGLLYFNQMLSVIKELELEEFKMQILFLTKEPEVFNLFNYQNLFSTKNEIEENNQKNENNDINTEQKEEKLVENLEKEEEKEEEKKEEEEEEKKEENKDRNNESSSSRKYEDEFDANINEKNLLSNEYENIEDDSHINKLDDLTEKILRKFAHFIVIEGSTPNLYLNPFKEEITQENKIIEVINPEKLFNFMQEKKIQISEKEKEEITNKFCSEINGNNNLKYINHDKFAEKLFELMKNDDNNYDEDFMKNIQNLEVDGFD